MKLTLLIFLVFPIFSLKAQTISPSQCEGSCKDVDKFLAVHWDRPLVSQGTLPESYKKMGISLDSKSCKSCHVNQFNDWKKSLHSIAMGPGLVGQLKEMAPDDFDNHQFCIRCHAPLQEQEDSLSLSLENLKKNKSSDKKKLMLHEQGLTCTACHTRNYEFNGPSRRDNSILDPNIASAFPHGGFKANMAFESSKFCAACHQFTEGEGKLNGKLFENTFNEWSESRFAKEGKSCQSCHMPDRRHLWKGIHDPETVKNGVKIASVEPVIEAGEIKAKLTIKSVEIGHRFPTYITPKVVMEAYQVDSKIKQLEGTKQTYNINREASMDLEKEIWDTRLAPDETASLIYKLPLHVQAKGLVFNIQVYPDDFYARFYEVSLAKKYTHLGTKEIQRALDDTKGRIYSLYRVYYPFNVQTNVQGEPAH